MVSYRERLEHFGIFRGYVRPALTQEQWMSGGSAIYIATYGYNAASLLTSASDNNSAYAYT